MILQCLRAFAQRDFSFCRCPVLLGGLSYSLRYRSMFKVVSAVFGSVFLAPRRRELLLAPLSRGRSLQLLSRACSLAPACRRSLSLSSPGQALLSVFSIYSSILFVFCRSQWKLVLFRVLCAVVFRYYLSLLCLCFFLSCCQSISAAKILIFFYPPNFLTIFFLPRLQLFVLCAMFQVIIGEK